MNLSILVSAFLGSAIGVPMGYLVVGCIERYKSRPRWNNVDGGKEQ